MAAYNETACSATAQYTAPAGWALAATVYNGPTTQATEIWYYAANPGGISSAVFTAACTGASVTLNGVMSEWSGVQATSPMDTSAGASPTGAATTTTTISATASVAGDLAVTSFAGRRITSGTEVWTPGAGWANLGHDSDTAFNHVTFDSQIAGAAGAVSELETVGTKVQWTNELVLFKPATGSVPAVTGLSATGGPAAGGTSVVITGTNFTGVSAVQFAATAAASYTFNSATQITATSPAGSGTVDVTVTAPGGTSAISASDHFTYIPAVLTITAPGSLTLPSLVDGSPTAATALGSLGWSDTLYDSIAPSVTMAAQDLWNAGASKGVAFTTFTIGIDQTLTAGGSNTGTAMTAGASPQTLSGTDTTAGTTYSTAITLATGSTTSQGTWTQANNTITVAVPANTALGTTFTATIQYTVTG
jgi:hypothetical protein